MKSFPASAYRLLLAGILLTTQSFAQQSSLHFFGNGYQSPGTDRIKIPLTDLNGANVSGDFTIECWIKCDASKNEGNVSKADHGDGWITGNVFLDRDVYGKADPGDFGFAIGSAPGLSPQARVIAFGINRKDEGITIQGKTHIADSKWHHMALTRNGSTGEIRLYIDGIPDAEGKGPAGNINYMPGRNTSYPDSDPFMVLGAEKHDGGGAYPSFNGSMDELRISNIIRYESRFTPPSIPFKPDAGTTALFHFDEGTGTTTKNDVMKADRSTDGIMLTGGDPAGPVWQYDSPFSDPAITEVREFSVFKDNKTIRLNWHSSKLAGLAFFEIQRSRDGKIFSSIERMNADPNCSNCTYKYADTHPFEGKNYYRILYTNASGKQTYSSMQIVSFNGKIEPYRIYQEGNSLVIRNNSKVESLVVWNSEGKRLLEKKMINEGSTRVPLLQSRGLAFVHITLDDGSRFTEKLLLR